jgi:hypothetical protein
MRHPAPAFTQEADGAAVVAALEQYDDMSRDIDEFRRDLARRIDAFVASRADASLPRSGE